MQEQYDNRFAKGKHFPGKVVLAAKQIKTVPVTGMIRCPCLARSLFVLSQDEENDVRDPGQDGESEHGRQGMANAAGGARIGNGCQDIE